MFRKDKKIEVNIEDKKSLNKHERIIKELKSFGCCLKTNIKACKESMELFYYYQITHHVNYHHKWNKHTGEKMNDRLFSVDSYLYSNILTGHIIKRYADGMRIKLEELEEKDKKLSGEYIMSISTCVKSKYTEQIVGLMESNKDYLEKLKKLIDCLEVLSNDN